MKNRAFFFGLVSALLFGTSTPVSKLLLESLSPFHLAGLLYIGSSLGVLPFLVRTHTLKFPSRRDKFTRHYLLGAIGLGGVCAPIFLLFGLQLASSASVALWLNLELLGTMVLGVLFFKDHLSPVAGLAGLGMIAASVLLSLHEGTSGWISGVLVLLACLCWGLDNHLTALIDGITPSQTTFWKGLIAGSVNLMIGSFVSGINWHAFTLLGALATGVIAYGASIVLYIHAAQLMGATRSQILFSSSPFFGVLFSVFLLGEHISYFQWTASAVMIVSIALIIFDRHNSHLHRHEAKEHEHWHRHDDGHHEHRHTSGTETTPGWHSHRHIHHAVIHAHTHLPDLHHRHTHEHSETDSPENVDN